MSESNEEAAQHLEAIAAAYDRRGEDPKAIAFRNAAQALRTLPVGGLRGLPAAGKVRGLGPSTLGVAREFFRSGGSGRLQELTRGLGPAEEAAVRLPPSLPWRALGRRGELHCHTSLSDGVESAEAMVTAAEALGYAWIGICDHASGVRPEAVGIDNLDLYRDVIDTVQDDHPKIRVHLGLEVDVSLDGALLAMPEVIDACTYFLAALHVRPDENVIRRVRAAIRHPKCLAIAHFDPAGVPEAEREGLAAELASAGVAVEITERHGVRPELLRPFALRGARLSVGADAHRGLDLGLLQPAYDRAAAAGWQRLINQASELPTR